MIYYKKINSDGTINMIGTQDTLPSDSVEIAETEYKELYKYIQENAVHEVIEFSQLNLEDGDAYEWFRFFIWKC